MKRLPPGQREPFADREQPGQPAPYTPDVQADVAENLRYRGDLKPGTVPLDLEVLSTYDTRPINGSDFIVATPPGGVPMPAGVPPQPVRFEVTVPPGYLMVVRGVQWTVRTYAGVPGSGGFAGWILVPQLSYPNNASWPHQYEFQIAVNGNVPPQFQITASSPFQGSWGRESFFLIVDEGDVLQWLHLTGVVFEQDQLWLKFYGNLLLKRGLPKNFEIAHNGRAARERAGVVL